MGRRAKKQLLPLIFLTLACWIMLAGIIIWVDPLVLRDFPLENSYWLFFLNVFFAWFFGLTLILNNSRRGFFYGLGATIFLMLRLIRLGNIVNAVLLGGLLVVIDFYFTNR